MYVYEDSLMDKWILRWWFGYIYMHCYNIFSLFVLFRGIYICDVEFLRERERILIRCGNIFEVFKVMMELKWIYNRQIESIISVY